MPVTLLHDAVRPTTFSSLRARPRNHGTDICQGYDEASFREALIGGSTQMPGITLVVNGARRDVEVAGDTPLLYVLRNNLELSGPQFGCGLSQCGACSVLLGGQEIRSCVTPLLAAT